MNQAFSVGDKVKYNYINGRGFGSIMKVDPDGDSFKYLIRPHTNHISQMNYLWILQVNIIQSLYRAANDS